MIPLETPFEESESTPPGMDLNSLITEPCGPGCGIGSVGIHDASENAGGWIESEPLERVFFAPSIDVNVRRRSASPDIPGHRAAVNVRAAVPGRIVIVSGIPVLTGAGVVVGVEEGEKILYVRETVGIEDVKASVLAAANQAISKKEDTGGAEIRIGTLTSPKDAAMGSRRCNGDVGTIEDVGRTGVFTGIGVTRLGGKIGGLYFDEAIWDNCPWAVRPEYCLAD